MGVQPAPCIFHRDRTHPQLFRIGRFQAGDRQFRPCAFRRGPHEEIACGVFGRCRSQTQKLSRMAEPEMKVIKVPGKKFT